MPSVQYFPGEIEARWQQYWAAHKTFRTAGPGQSGFDPAKKKYYVLDMFPYPSGAGLHVGHPEGYTATDILARFRRMQGRNVLHPMGWDAFGLPAEQYAVQTGTHPATTTHANIGAFRATLQRLGFSYDWDREVDTTASEYYHWTQWIFLLLFNSIFDPRTQKARDVTEIVADLDAGRLGIKDGAAIFFEIDAAAARAAGRGPQWSELDSAARWRVLANHRLAYVSDAPVWWCEALGTVLANEEVIDGHSERGDHPCVKKPLRQWVLRITAYAERLVSDLESIDWPESIRIMQRHWVGRSEGAEVDFVAQASSLHESPVAQASSLHGSPVAQASSLHGTSRQDACATAGTSRQAACPTVRVFTTRPDTLYGATYMVLAPEHPLVRELTAPEAQAAVTEYVLQASRKSDLARTDLAKEKSGVFTGSYAFNPVYDAADPRARIPIWIADYVLMGYGTGAIMAVPAHDERDAEFAVKFKLPILTVVMPPDAWLKANAKEPGADVAELRRRYTDNPLAFKAFFIDDGVSFRSPIFDGLPTPDAKKKIAAWLEEHRIGQGKVTYRLRDWLFSRQRYWGEPFPIVWDQAGLARALTADALPVKLPELSDFKPTGSPEGPLSKATEWVRVPIVVNADGSARVVPPGTPGAQAALRETNTMPQWAGSCWYYLRYLDPHNPQAPCSTEAERYWMNVDLYVGGAEHAVLHLLYSRFWHKVLFDRGIVHTAEPFQRLFNQGLIQAFVYQTSAGRLVPNDDVEELPDGSFRQKSTGTQLTQAIGKMSKSLKNVIPADDVLAEYGADTLRLYEMFMGPLDGSKPWNPRDVPGMYRFLRDCWRMIVDDDESRPQAGSVRAHLATVAQASSLHEALERELHKTIKGVTQDLERMAFNTAISKLMVFKNHALAEPQKLSRSQAERFLLLLGPFAPHIAEELWSRMGHTESLALERWPVFEESLTQDAVKELAVQVNGKLRARITVATGLPDDEVKVLAQQAVQTELAGKTIVKMIVVPGRLVNIVVK